MQRSRGRSLGGLVSELIVVFVGVLLAFAAENWREERSFRADARESLRLMLGDLASDSAEFEDLAESLERKTGELAWLVQMRDRAEVPADSVAQVLWTFNNQVRITPSRTAWEGIENANRIAWIEPDSLRFALRRYYQGTHGEYAYWQGILDESGAILILEELFEHVEMLPGREPGRLWPARENRLPLASSWSDFKGDRMLQNQLISYGRIVDFLAGYARNAGLEATGLMAAIRSELE